MENIIKPLSLQKGDLIGIYSPSSGIGENLMKNYNRGKQLLLDAGYRLIEAPHTFEELAHYSSKPENKVSDFMFLLNHPDVKAILPTVGGTTSYQMMPLMNFNKIKKILREKPIMIFGFSDNSLIASIITNYCNCVTFHGHSDVVFGLGDLADEVTMQTFQAKGEYTKKYLFNSLEGRYSIGAIEKLSDWKILKKGNAEGKLLGGNIDVLQILHGTPFTLDWENCIFYWEACYLDLHRVDLALASFALTGALSKISGMVVGKSNTLKETFYTKYESIEEIILRHCEKYNFPIIVNADFGHNVECCMLPNGLKASIEGDTLYLIESPYSE